MSSFSSDYASNCYYVTSSLDRQRSRPVLDTSISTETLVIGAGFTGLHTAWQLATMGREVVVIDAGRVGGLASGRNGGQIIMGYSCDMARLERQLGLSQAREAWNLTRWAAQHIRDCIVQHAIDCDYQSGFLYTAVQPHRVKSLQHWVEQAKYKWGYDRLTFLTRTELDNHIASQRYHAGVLDPEGGHFHPLKFCLGLAQVIEQKGGIIYESTCARSWQPTHRGIEVETDRGKIQCDSLVLACNTFIGQLEPSVGSKILPVGSYIATTETLGQRTASALIPSNVCVCDNQLIPDYFRLTRDHRLLFGSGFSDMRGRPLEITRAIRSQVEKVFPQLQGVRFDHAWGGYIDATMHRTPEFGHRNNVYWALGFSGHGVVPTAVAGRVIAEAISGNPYYLELFQQIANTKFPFGRFLGRVLETAEIAYHKMKALV